MTLIPAQADVAACVDSDVVGDGVIDTAPAGRIVDRYTASDQINELLSLGLITLNRSRFNQTMGVAVVQRVTIMTPNLTGSRKDATTITNQHC
ncbi:hypothetical protein [Corynebacterium glutamicum]|uniref:hypothetical protein n=1 Tax=Corynebacterium glutamicum TaxID=1718 RepID=UPI0021BDEC7F|nr:hypothetical protein [Corynebacterium glutamicum]